MASRFRAFIEVMSHAVVVLGVPAFFYQQWEGWRTGRIEHTLDYIQAFQSDRMTAVRYQLLEPWLSYTEEIEAMNAAGGINQDLMTQWVDGMVDASAERKEYPNLRSSIFEGADFYDRLHICVASKVCERETAQAYFKRDAAQFHCLYGSWLTSMKGKLRLEGLGEGVRVFTGTEACS